MGRNANYGSIAEKGESFFVGPRSQSGGPPDLSNWMSKIDDETPLSALSIPGTHDSAAFKSSVPFITTQRMNTLEQLNAGIRYFDIRCGIVSDVVQMVHGRAVLGLRFDEMLDTMYAWLDAHPREALILQVKRDREEEDATKTFPDLIIETIAPKSKYWRVQSNTPSIGEVRGKIQLFRRFTGRGLYAYGINVTRWQDNPVTPFTIHTYHGVQLTIQDHYRFATAESLPNLVTKKGGDVAFLLERAALDPSPYHWYINFTSAFEINIYYQIPPRDIAAGGYWIFRWVEGMNVRLYGTFCTKPKGKRRYGIVAMDFPEGPAPDLIKSVVDSNFETRKTSDWTPQVIMWTLAALLTTLILAGLYISSRRLEYV